jgi:hypothetical protein
MKPIFNGFPANARVGEARGTNAAVADIFSSLRRVI